MELGRGKFRQYQKESFLSEDIINLIPLLKENVRLSTGCSVGSPLTGALGCVFFVPQEDNGLDPSQPLIYTLPMLRIGMENHHKKGSRKSKCVLTVRWT